MVCVCGPWFGWDLAGSLGRVRDGFGVKKQWSVVVKDYFLSQSCITKVILIVSYDPGQS